MPRQKKSKEEKRKKAQEPRSLYYSLFLYYKIELGVTLILGTERENKKVNSKKKLHCKLCPLFAGCTQ